MNWADENTPSPDSRAASVDITYVEGMDDPSNWWYYNIEHDYFASKVVGDPLEDTRNPIDFSSYGKSYTPFAIQDMGDEDPDAMETYYPITMPSNINFTIELWYAASPNAQTCGIISLGSAYWDETNSWLEFSSWENYDTHVKTFHLRSWEDASIDFGEGITDSNWHHYAISCDGTNLYFFVDGVLGGTCILTEKDKTQIAAITQCYMQGFNWSCNKGRFAQIAFCPQCKWTSNFTPSTIAYRNAT